MLHVRGDHSSIQDLSGVTRIGDKEPAFLLHATDPTASVALRLYAAYALRAGQDADYCARLQEFADEMDEYAAEHKNLVKLPSIPRNKVLPSNRVSMPKPNFCQHCGNNFREGHKEDCPVLALDQPTVYTQR